MRRRFQRELSNARLRWVHAEQEVVERWAAIDRNDDLAVDDELLCLQRVERINQFREISRERLSAFRLNRDLVAVAKNNRAKAVPLRLELPSVAFRKLLDTVRFHRRVRWADGKRHFFLNILPRSNLFLLDATGFQRSPASRTRSRTLSMRKSSMRTPPSISSQVTGVDTDAIGVGRTE